MLYFKLLFHCYFDLFVKGGQYRYRRYIGHQNLKNSQAPPPDRYFWQGGSVLEFNTWIDVFEKKYDTIEGNLIASEKENQKSTWN
jgi:hypothetical protein